MRLLILFMFVCHPMYMIFALLFSRLPTSRNSGPVRAHKVGSILPRVKYGSLLSLEDFGTFILRRLASNSVYPRC